MCWPQVLCRRAQRDGLPAAGMLLSIQRPDLKVKDALGAATRKHRHLRPFLIHLAVSCLRPHALPCRFNAAANVEVAFLVRISVSSLGFGTGRHLHPWNGTYTLERGDSLQLTRGVTGRGDSKGRMGTVRKKSKGENIFLTVMVNSVFQYVSALKGSLLLPDYFQVSRPLQKSAPWG